MFGLEDRLWIGYWSGGATLSIMGFICVLADMPFWIAFMMWVATTPLGIMITKHRVAK